MASHEECAMRKRFPGSRTAWSTLLALGALLFVVLALAGTSARGQPRKSCQQVPATWTPSLDEIRNYLAEKANAEARASQRQLTQSSQLLADLDDARLFIAYVHLMQTLRVTGQEKLFEEQKRWLGKRAEAARASVVSKGGTLGTLEYSDAFGRITRERLAELQERLRRQGGTTQERKEGDPP